MSKTPLSRAPGRRKALIALTKRRKPAIVRCRIETAQGPPIGVIDSGHRPSETRMPDAEWRLLVELLAGLHADDLGAALAVLRLRKRF